MARQASPAAAAAAARVSPAARRARGPGAPRPRDRALRNRPPAVVEVCGARDQQLDEPAARPRSAPPESSSSSAATSSTACPRRGRPRSREPARRPPRGAGRYRRPAVEGRPHAPGRRPAPRDQTSDRRHEPARPRHQPAGPHAHAPLSRPPSAGDRAPLPATPRQDGAARQRPARNARLGSPTGSPSSAAGAIAIASGARAIGSARARRTRPPAPAGSRSSPAAGRAPPGTRASSPATAPGRWRAATAQRRRDGTLPGCRPRWGRRRRAPSPPASRCAPRRRAPLRSAAGAVEHLLEVRARDRRQRTARRRRVRLTALVSRIAGQPIAVGLGQQRPHLRPLARRPARRWRAPASPSRPPAAGTGAAPRSPGVGELGLQARRIRHRNRGGLTGGPLDRLDLGGPSTRPERSQIRSTRRFASWASSPRPTSRLAGGVAGEPSRRGPRRDEISRQVAIELVDDRQPLDGRIVVEADPDQRLAVIGGQLEPDGGIGPGLHQDPPHLLGVVGDTRRLSPSKVTPMNRSAIDQALVTPGCARR